jgi:hypothetical protein
MPRLCYVLAAGLAAARGGDVAAPSRFQSSRLEEGERAHAQNRAQAREAGGPGKEPVPRGRRGAQGQGVAIVDQNWDVQKAEAAGRRRLEHTGNDDDSCHDDEESLCSESGEMLCHSCDFYCGDYDCENPKAKAEVLVNPKFCSTHITIGA